MSHFFESQSMRQKYRPSRYVPGELSTEEEKTALKTANEKYEKFKKEKVGSDMYSHNFSQTLDPPKKVKVGLNLFCATKAKNV